MAVVEPVSQTINISRRVIVEDDSDLSDDISIIEPGRSIELFDNTKPSPYAQRRGQAAIPKSVGYRRAASGELEIIEDHYSVGVESVYSSSSAGSLDFTVIDRR